MDNNIKTVLIVDDVKEIQDYLSQLLIGMGFWSIDCASTGKEAFDFLSQKRYDIIFLDIELPDSNGKEMLDRISYEYTDSKVVMCSGHNTLENVKQTWEMGAKGFVSKPFDEAKVSTIIKRLDRG
jgi:two-component system chemotaxis response regulator CheY